MESLEIKEISTNTYIVKKEKYNVLKVEEGTDNVNITELIEKKTVYIEGKIQIDNYRGESTSKLLVDKLVELDKIYEYPAKKLFILIEPEDSYRYSRLKDLINYNKGKTQVTFAIKNKDEKKLQTINKGVKLSKEFFENLVELMGIGKIKFEM